jgi:hypothetical protein
VDGATASSRPKTSMIGRLLSPFRSSSARTHKTKTPLRSVPAEVSSHG